MFGSRCFVAYCCDCSLEESTSVGRDARIIVQEEVGGGRDEKSRDAPL